MKKLTLYILIIIGCSNTDITENPLLNKSEGLEINFLNGAEVHLYQFEDIATDKKIRINETFTYKESSITIPISSHKKSANNSYIPYQLIIEKKISLSDFSEVNINSILTYVNKRNELKYYSNGQTKDLGQEDHLGNRPPSFWISYKNLGEDKYHYLSNKMENYNAHLLTTILNPISLRFTMKLNSGYHRHFVKSGYEITQLIDSWNLNLNITGTY